MSDPIVQPLPATTPIPDPVISDPANVQPVIVPTQVDTKLREMEANSKALAVFLGEQERQAKLQEQINSSDKVLAAQCTFLLNTALSASRLPEVVQARLHKNFEGIVFQPAQLQIAIDEARTEVSALTGSLAVQGPGRIGGMFNTDDQLQAAFDDLLGAPRDPGKDGLKVARLSGIREAYLMLTGDYDLHGGYDPIRATLSLMLNLARFVQEASLATLPAPP
jgi:hypothetical protein